MKTKYFIIISACLLVVLNSCRPIMMTLYGVHSPRVETDISLLKYCRKIGLRTDNILRPKDSISFRQIIKENNSVPELRVFNNKGQLLLYRNSNECNAKAFNLTEIFCDTIPFINSISGSMQLNTEFDLLRKVGNENKMILPQDSAFTILIYWGKWSGRLNKDHVRIWEHQLASARCGVQVYKISTDLIP